MARPVVSQAAENLYEILSPLAYADESLDWPLLKYCEALAMNLQLVLDYGGDWSQIVDIDRVPYEAIPWLGQLVGVTTPPRIQGETETAHEDRIREYVRGVPGFARGTPAAIIQAAQQYLTGTKTVILRERQGGAYMLQVLTWVGETADSAKVLAALLAQKPAGIVLDYDVLTGQDFQLVYTNHPDFQDVYNDYSTWQGMFVDTPGL